MGLKCAGSQLQFTMGDLLICLNYCIFLHLVSPLSGSNACKSSLVGMLLCPLSQVTWVTPFFQWWGIWDSLSGFLWLTHAAPFLLAFILLICHVCLYNRALQGNASQIYFHIVVALSLHYCFKQVYGLGGLIWAYIIISDHSPIITPC